MQSAPAMPYAYRAYGCNLVSDLPLARLSPGPAATMEPAPDTAPDTIAVHRCQTLPDIPGHATQMGPYSWAAPDFLSLNVEGVVQLVAMNGNRLLYRPYPGVDAMSVQLFLMGSGLAAILMQRRFLVMHGNAVEMDGMCVMCVGPSGAGKSTTAAGMMQRGHRVMSDDICVINAEGQIVPGMPHIKLWQQAADGLGLSTDALDPVRPRIAKFGLPLEDAFCADLRPVRRIYVLAGHMSGTIACERLNSHEKFKALCDNTYRLPFVAAMGLKALHFQQVTTLSKQVTVTRIRRPFDGFHLTEVLDAITEDALGQAASR